jgi:two-component system NtrC family sensor kinase
MSMAWVGTAIANAVRNVLITTGLAMAVGTLGIFFLANLITRPLLALRDAAEKLGKGDLASQAPARGSREIADLGHAFNNMAGQIKGRISESDELRAYMERVLDQMESSIFVVSETGRVEYANRVASDRHGSLCGSSCNDVMNQERPCWDCPAPTVLSTGSVVQRRYHAPSGSSYDLTWMPILGRDGKRAVVERALDVTERLQFQERLQRAQRLAVAGEIAAGVVHSVNNPLDGVIRALDLATDHPDDPDRVDRMLALAREGMDRIGNITRSLLGFARGDAAPKPTLVHVDALIEAAVNLSRLRAEAGDVEVRIQVEGDRTEVQVDPQGMEEVLVNLVLNAVDACEEGGRVSIRAQVDAAELEISVEASGPGVPLEDAERVFEPFFTTKGAERGTGLGLPVARRIVEAHGGELVLDSPAGGGATFVVRVPLPPRPRQAEEEVGVA